MRLPPPLLRPSLKPPRPSRYPRRPMMIPTRRSRKAGARSNKPCARAGGVMVMPRWVSAGEDSGWERDGSDG